MSQQPIVWTRCPKCRQQSGTVLPIRVNKTSDYYECDACGHVWTQPKPPLPKPTRSPVPIQRRCPHCDSRNIEPMKARSYEAQSTNTWYECCDCRRLWSVPKPKPDLRSGGKKR